jgi:histidine kinase/DNA gyrase B/HSP90-like ATPase
MESPPKLLDSRFVPFASGKKASAETILGQHVLLSSPAFNTRLFSAFPGMAVVLNSERQIVFSNQALLDYVGAGEMEEVCGLRLGQVLSCIHAQETKGGCGTTEFCTVCGTLEAILSGQLGRGYHGDCRVRSKPAGQEQALDLEVTATPIEVEGHGFTIVCAVDASDRMRKLALERVYNTDVLGALRELRALSAGLDLAASPGDQRQIVAAIVSSSKLLEAQLGPYEQLDAAEKGTLQVDRREISSLALLESLRGRYRSHPAAQGQRIKIDPQSENISFISDPVLVGQVIGNMIENALEASAVGDTVTLRCRVSDAHVVFQVHNPSAMERRHQLQVFQRSFTTRGPGRGLGTYMMKLIGERYLKGTIAFDSSAEDGTTFTATFLIGIDAG